MKKKINTICFIFLFLFLICAVSATNNENETIISTPQLEPDEDLCKISIETLEKSEKLEASNTAKKESVSMNAPDLKMYYKDGSKFSVTLKDKSKKAISKAKVTITVNGKSYEKTTNSKGTATLDINLKSGSYAVLSSFAGNSKYNSKSAKSTLTVKSTVKCSDFTKYYTNKASYYSTFYTQKGKLLKETNIKFKINGKVYSVKTNSKGVGKLEINLKPGKYVISSINSKTSETINKNVIVKTLIETKDITFNETDSGKFNVKILNCYGKASPNKKVTLNVDGKTYTKTTNKNGLATLYVNLDAGTYRITTEYNGLKNTNNIIVNKVKKTSDYIHTTLIPNYVNVTANYVYYNSAYSVKTGINGTVKMPKNELITVQIGSKTYKFTTTSILGYSANAIGYKSHLIPFDGSSVKSDLNKSKLEGNGIIISKAGEFTQIDYKSTTKENTELFGFYAGKGLDKTETFTYMENETITAKVNVQTLSYDELGLKYSLSKFYGKTIYNFNYNDYSELEKSVKFTNTGKPVTFSYFGNYIVGYPSKEDITTKFTINGKEELEKEETISYGLSEKYRNAMGFEILQSYSIINEKITEDILENWISQNSNYLNRFGVMNVYGMHLASLESAWLADALADNYTKDFNVKWKRADTVTILGGINLEDTYLNILNADMGMEVTGSDENSIILFRLLNSINLPNIEDYALNSVSYRYMTNSTNSQDNVFQAMKNNRSSIVQLGELLYLFSEDGTKSGIVLNTTSGVCSVIVSSENSVYKGTSVPTSRDCCSVGILPKDIIAGIKNSIKLFAPGIYVLSDKLNKIHPFNLIAYKGLTYLLGKTLTGASSAATGLFTAMALVQTGGTIIRDGMIDEKNWHKAMDSVTFTRPGYLQSKKVYNIPNKNGGYDYVEVKINNDLTLDRNNAIYISNGQTKKLTETETYQYFCEDSWTPFSMPSKYWDKSWKGE